MSLFCIFHCKLLLSPEQMLQRCNIIYFHTVYSGICVYSTSLNHLCWYKNCTQQAAQEESNTRDNSILCYTITWFIMIGVFPWVGVRVYVCAVETTSHHPIATPCLSRERAESSSEPFHLWPHVACRGTTLEHCLGQPVLRERYTHTTEIQQYNVLEYAHTHKQHSYTQ